MIPLVLIPVALAAAFLWAVLGPASAAELRGGGGGRLILAAVLLVLLAFSVAVLVGVGIVWALVKLAHR